MSRRYIMCVGGPACGDELEADAAMNSWPVWLIPQEHPHHELQAYERALAIGNPPTSELRHSRTINGKSVTCSFGPLSPLEQAVQALTPCYALACQPHQPEHAIGGYVAGVRITNGDHYHALTWRRALNCAASDDDDATGVLG